MIELRESITAAFKYLDGQGVEIPLHLLVQARRKGIAIKQVSSSYGLIRSNYWAAVYDAVYDYLVSEMSISTFKNNMKKAMVEAFLNTAELAYTDGGGTLPMDEDTLAWLGAQQSAELGYMDTLFLSLKEMRGEPDTDPIHESFRRADGYADTLDSIYNGAKAFAAGNKMLTFSGEDGEESCRDCKRYKGKRHRAKWWITYDAVPPNRSFECKGYRCQHQLLTDNGERFTL